VLLPSGTLPGVTLPSSAGLGSGSSLGAMATVVLTETVHPQAGSNAPPANRRLGGVSPSIGQMPTQANLAPSAQTPTQVNLTPPAAPPPARINSSPSAAQMPTQVIAAPIPAYTPAAPVKHAPSVSSTAKTQDLKANRPVQPPVRSSASAAPITAKQPPTRPASTPARSSGASGSSVSPSGVSSSRSWGASASSAQSNGTARSVPAAPTARLISRVEGSQFNLGGGRIVIGRSVDSRVSQTVAPVGSPAASPAVSSNDPPDIDLATLKRGIERVSRRHAEIIRKNGAWFIRDLGSLNGTYIGGRGRLGRDQLYQLKDRDELVLGDARFEFRES